MCFLALCGCSKMQEVEGDSSEKKVRVVFELEKESYEGALKILEKVEGEIPAYPDEQQAGDRTMGWGTRFALDTAKYLLQISDNKGNIFYDGLYIEKPEYMDLPAGTYNIKLRSGEFKEPSKDMPLFGEDRTIKAVADSTIRIQLVSAQLTGGIRVKATKNFINFFKGNGLYYVKDTAVWKQSYYGTYLYIFFHPGDVNIVYKNRDGSSYNTPPTKPSWEDTVILTRRLKATDLVSIELDYDMARANTGGFSIKVDTVRNRYDNYYNTAFFAPYGSVSVVYAKTHVGDTVRLWGYIVGGNASQSSFSKKKPFTSKTHIVVAKESWQSLRENVMAVELPNGYIRNDLNLVDHPDLIKRKIVLDGVIVDTYFGYPGLKSVTAYKLY